MTNGSYLDKQAIQKRVRAAALWAAIAAAIMLWYYYPREAWSVYKDNPQRMGGLLLLFTLQFGGWTMVLSTVLLLTGAVRALLFDAIAAALCGSLIVVSGLLMFPAGGMQPLLYVILGGLFAQSGVNAWREFRTLSPVAGSGSGGTRYEILGPGLNPPAPPPESQTALDRLRNRAAPTQPQPEPQSALPEETRPQESSDESPGSKAEPIPEGFLAQFGKGDPRSRS